MTQVSFGEWLVKFQKLSLTKKLELQRKAGFPAYESNWQEQRRKVALNLGLSESASTERVIFNALQHAVGCPCQENQVGENFKCYAVELPITEVRTDPDRFQNRTDAFSELSAQSVAEHYDGNKFDPVVVWIDPEDGKTYVLSGHSRYEGMKRRKSKTVPVRFFEGTEAEAIQFAKVDANRAANVENMVEDLKAYRLMRDGDETKEIDPASKAELNRVFKGKASKLEAYSYLNAAGLFISALGQDNRSNFPHLEVRAQWVGQIRKENEEMTDRHEDDCFYFFYGSENNLVNIDKDTFFKEVAKRLAWGKDRLFPECSAAGCEKLKDLAEYGQHKDLYKELNRLTEDRKSIEDRFKTSKAGLRIYTENEKEALRSVATRMDEDIKRLRRDLGVVENQTGLFGIGKLNDILFYPESQLVKLQKSKITKEEIQEVFEGRVKSMHENVSLKYDKHQLAFAGMSSKKRFIGFYARMVIIDEEAKLLIEGPYMLDFLQVARTITKMK